MEKRWPVKQKKLYFTYIFINYNCNFDSCEYSLILDKIKIYYDHVTSKTTNLKSLKVHYKIW